ncbi:MAG: sialidase family protein [Acidobacteria bacterium]|nr:sialidase family protein [Acidobacteriota bacterium]
MLLITLLSLAAAIQPAGAPAPARQPQLAIGAGQVAITFGAGSHIYFAASPDGGQTFGAPVKVAEVGALALGRHRGPRLAILKDALVISAIAGQAVATGPHAHGLPDQGDLLVWRSTDQGRTWTRTGKINDVPGAAREGLHAMAVAPDGTLSAAWLDLRSKGTLLYGARSVDGGRSWSKNELIYSSPDGTICQCCHPALAADQAAGSLWVMWRNVVEGSRDLYAARSGDGLHFGTAQKLGTGTWKLNACPMDGGGLAVADGKVTSAWRRDSDVFLSAAGEPDQKVGTGKDVALALTRQGPVVAWTADGGIQARLPGAVAPVELAKPGAFVNLLTLPDGTVLAAWETGASIETKVLAAR